MLDEDKPLISTPFSHEECNNIDIANPRIGFIIISDIKKTKSCVLCPQNNGEKTHFGTTGLDFEVLRASLLRLGL
jgi:hypothetical protein